MIQYRCDCSRVLQADEAQAGQRARCPSCGAIAAIPSESIQDAAPARRPRREEEPARGAMPRVLILVSVMLFGLMACGGAWYLAIMPAFAQFAEAKERREEGNNLKWLGIGMHAFYDTRGHLPRPAIESPDGKPLLSWRVALLPYLEHEALYKQFRLEEPWDSDHNKQLIPMMPKLFLRSDQVSDGSGKTHYQAIVGRGLMFDFKYANPDGKPSGRPMVSITDGVSNTIMLVVAKDPVIWTKPDDIDADNGMPILPRLDSRFKAGTSTALGDGRVRMIRPTVSEATLRAALTAEGGEVLGADFD